MNKLLPCLLLALGLGLFSLPAHASCDQCDQTDPPEECDNDDDDNNGDAMPEAVRIDTGSIEVSLLSSLPSEVPPSQTTQAAQKASD